MGARAARRAFEQAGGGQLRAVAGQNGALDARKELHRRGTRLVGSVARFPERYGADLIRLAVNIPQNKPVPAAVFVKHKLLTTQIVDLIYPLDGEQAVTAGRA